MGWVEKTLPAASRAVVFSGSHKKLILKRRFASSGLYVDLLNLIKRDLVTGPIVQFGRCWRLVIGNSLRVLKEAAALQVGCDAGCPKRMAIGFGCKAGTEDPFLDHQVGVFAVQAILG